MSQAATDIKPRDIGVLLPEWLSPWGASLLCLEPGSYGNTGPYPQLPCLALAESVQYSLQLVLDTPGPQPENIQPDTPIPDDSEQSSHPEPGH